MTTTNHTQRSRLSPTLTKAGNYLALICLCGILALVFQTIVDHWISLTDNTVSLVLSLVLLWATFTLGLHKLITYLEAREMQHKGQGNVITTRIITPRQSVEL